jgi:hypothetical protein
VFQGYVSGIEQVVGRAHVLFERTVLLAFLLNLGSHPLKVESRKDPVVRNHMVSFGGFEIMQVTEAGGLRMSEEEWQVRVTIINCINFFSM